MSEQIMYTPVIPYGFKHKHLLLFPLLIVILFVVFLNNGIAFRFPSSTVHIEWNKLDEKYRQDESDRHYFIKTKGCSIPAFTASNTIVSSFYHVPNNIKCHNNTNPPLVESDDRKLYVVDKYLSDYGIKDKTEFHCFYQAFYRPDSNTSTSDDRYLFENETYAFKTQISVHSEFVKVECVNRGMKIYKDYHSFVLPLTKKILTKELKQSYNVLIVGVDSISRLNFHRTMPKTHKYLKEIGAFDFQGYNKVGDNTYPNLVPILTGLSKEEIKSECVSDKLLAFDDCPFVWKLFKNKGFTTMYAEDASDISLFNYMKNGFVHQPTDYYWRTFNFVAETDIGHKHIFNANLCVGPRLTLDTLLDYTKKFLNTASDYMRFFGFFWETSLTHDDLNFPVLADDRYLSLLMMLRSKDLLSNTVVVFLSDHGIRWGEIRKTYQGRIEERLPFLYVILPSDFSTRYPLAFDNMRRNTKRLTTPFDLHEMLVELTQPDNLKDDRLTKIAKTRGISLFHLIPDSRTCESAAIGDHWCTCNRVKKISTNSTDTVIIAKFVVDHVNNLLKGHAQCAKLNLSKILDATEGSSRKTDDATYIFQDYTVVLETVPGKGLFEATVRKGYSGMNITGTVSRINLYGSQSRCMDNFHLKLYCFCDIALSNYRLFG